MAIQPLHGLPEVHTRTAPRAPITPFVRITIVITVTGAFLTLAGATFWYQDWRYSLPTPRPPELIQAAVGSRHADVLARAGIPQPDRPVLLHFFNPACPCSRFNLDHVRDLSRQFGGRVTMLAVLHGTGAPEKLQAAWNSWDLGLAAVVDEDGQLARDLGVYSTPQAVLLDHNGRLYFRGNYNVNRYCEQRQTQFARLAIESLLAGNPPPELPAATQTAYGCPLPVFESKLVTYRENSP